MQTGPQFSAFKTMVLNHYRVKSLVTFRFRLVLGNLPYRDTWYCTAYYLTHFGKLKRKKKIKRIILLRSPSMSTDWLLQSHESHGVSKQVYSVILRNSFCYEIKPDIKSAPLRAQPWSNLSLWLATQTLPQCSKNVTLTHPGVEQALWYYVININTKMMSNTMCSGEESRKV